MDCLYICLFIKPPLKVRRGRGLYSCFFTNVVFQFAIAWMWCERIPQMFRECFNFFFISFGPCTICPSQLVYGTHLFSDILSLCIANSLFLFLTWAFADIWWRICFLLFLILLSVVASGYLSLFYSPGSSLLLSFSRFSSLFILPELNPQIFRFHYLIAA